MASDDGEKSTTQNAAQDSEKGRFSHPDHESLPELSDNDSDVASHHDGDLNTAKGNNSDGHSQHSDDDDDEAEEHHDPEPEGPEGLNTDVLTPQISRRARSQSRASSARSRPLVIVPRAERRGLFAHFVLIPEVERPYDYSRKTKWLITLIVALAAAGGPIGSNIMYRTWKSKIPYVIPRQRPFWLAGLLDYLGRNSLLTCSKK